MQATERTVLGFDLPRSPFEREKIALDAMISRGLKPFAFNKPVKLTDEERRTVGRSTGPAIRWAQAYGIHENYVYELRRRARDGRL